MNKKHLVFIINPRAGVERTKEIKEALEDRLDKHAYTYELQHTQHAGHGTALAAAAAEKGAYAVVAVGGDGSINDIIRGLLDAGGNTALAIIPKGSGNGMARTMHIPLDVAGAIDVLNKGRVVPADVAFANGRAFISNAGVAFDALISKNFAKSVRRGFAVYSWLVTKYMWLYKPWSFDITVDGKKIHSKAFMVIVANGQQFGYNFRIAPMADYTDGLLDVVIVRNFPKILGGVIAVRAMTGNILGSRYVQHLRGTKVVIAHPSLRLMQTDGDAHECLSQIEFTIRKGAQNVIVP